MSGTKGQFFCLNRGGGGGDILGGPIYGAILILTLSEPTSRLLNYLTSFLLVSVISWIDEYVGLVMVVVVVVVVVEVEVIVFRFF